MFLHLGKDAILNKFEFFDTKMRGASINFVYLEKLFFNDFVIHESFLRLD